MTEAALPGTVTDVLSARADRVLMANYRRAPVAFRNGRGARVTAANGRTYLDLLGGIAVNVLGHAHPRLAAALGDQAATLLHTSNLYQSELQIEAAELLVATAFDSRAFFCNSGTEANEAAIKLARKWGRERGRERGTIICARGAFHGRTLGALAATAESRYREPFEPLPAGFVHVEYDNADAVRAAIDDTTVAVMMEPIEGESGVIPMRDETLQLLRELCDERDILLMLDEIQTGMGRTGRWWGHEHAGVTPDVMTVAKGLGGGVPIGAVLAAPRADVLGAGDHGTTFGGNALACRAAITVLRTIDEDGLIENAARVGHALRTALIALATRGLPIESVRGRGLMLGVVLGEPIAQAVGAACLDEGVLINAIGDRVLRLLPPLTLTHEEADEGVDRIARALTRAADATTTGANP